jgi:biopolymer transport protein ExbB/TolQ
MTLFNFAQLLLAAVALALIAERFRTLFYRARLDPGPFLQALQEELSAGRLHAARLLAQAGRPAWLAELAHAVLQAEQAGEGVDVAAEETCSDLSDEAARRIYVINGLARVATPLALLGVILELTGALAHRSGLQALQAGLLENTALSRALATLAIGIATTAVCFVASTMLRKRALAAIAELRRGVDVLQEAIGPRGGADSVE